MKVIHHLIFGLLFMSLSIFHINSQNTYVVHLNEQEQQNLRALYEHNADVKKRCDSVIRVASDYLNYEPKPVQVIYYEGMLETDTARIRTVKSLKDMDKVSTLFYASYVRPNPAYGKKIKKYILAWSQTYIPTGNTINENKFVPLLWGYHLFSHVFGDREKKMVEDWMKRIADKQIAREHTPNNNWMAKRLRLIGLIGGITNNKSFIDYAIKHLKEHINTAYYADGTSNDLHKRDALHYHISGLKTLVVASVNLPAFDSRFKLFDYETKSGASIKNSVLYTLPYATGEKEHKEWVHTKVELDKKRALAGIAEYQPGVLFDRKKAVPLFEFAVYYNPDWYAVLDNSNEKNYAATWIGLLNSPLVREK